MIPQIDREANAAWAEYQKGLKDVDENPSWSEQGKRDQAARLKATYDGKVEQLRAQGSLQADSERRTNALGLQLARHKENDQLREAVGDAEAARIIRARLERMTSAQIGRAYEEAEGDKWARALVQAWGGLIVEGRTGARDATPEDYAAQAVLARQKDTDLVRREQRAHELEPERVAAWLETLDRGAHAQRMASKLGVSAKYWPLPEV